MLPDQQQYKIWELTAILEQYIDNKNDFKKDLLLFLTNKKIDNHEINDNMLVLTNWCTQNGIRSKKAIDYIKRVTAYEVLRKMIDKENIEQERAQLDCLYLALINEHQALRQTDSNIITRMFKQSLEITRSGPFSTACALMTISNGVMMVTDSNIASEEVPTEKFCFNLACLGILILSLSSEMYLRYIGFDEPVAEEEFQTGYIAAPQAFFAPSAKSAKSAKSAQENDTQEEQIMIDDQESLPQAQGSQNIRPDL